MDIVENTLNTDLDEFLARPLFAHIATVSAEGAPRNTPVWFLWEDGSLWVIANTDQRTVHDRIEDDPRVGVGIVDFDVTTGLVEHVGIRGQAAVVPHDPDRAERLLERYLGPNKETWDAERFGDPQEWGEAMVLLRIDPETVVARDQSYAPEPS
jgi:general stress protein 26